MRFGVIGCGTIAQIMHIPHVVAVPAGELYAIADPSADLVATLGDRYNVPNQFTSVDDMIEGAGDELDAVVVLTPPSEHAAVVETTLEAGVHTLVEKPLALSPADADRMVAAAEASDAVAMVAYMKRYDPAYEQAQSEVADLDAVDRVTAYDVDPDHGRIIDEVYDLVEADPPAAVVRSTRTNRRADSKAAIGVDDDDLAAEYGDHLEHVCHDVNLLRGLFGDVERIDHVDRYADGRYLTAHLVYDGDVRCTLDSGFSDRKWFEEFVRVDAPDRVVQLEFGNPFIRNDSTELVVRQGTDDLSSETRVPSYEESFKRELEQFVACIEAGAAVRTTFAEARDDVRLVADLFRTHLAEPTLGEY
jgi:predicted dehydrogenase